MDFESQQLSELSEDLQTMHRVVPGLEATFNTGLATHAELCETMVITGEVSMLPTHNEAASLLKTDNLESLPQRVFEQLIMPYFQAKRDNPALNEIWDAFCMVPAGAESGYSTRLEDDFYKTFEKYVLWSAPLETVLQRCRQDQAYLSRRVEDIRALPFLMVAQSILSDINRGKDRQAHQMLEVGLPAFRVGAAVLNDFMTYGSRDLPASFRLSHWPSQVPITEVIAGLEGQSDAQVDMVLRNAEHVRTGMSFLRNSGIISQFIADQETEVMPNGNH